MANVPASPRTQKTVESLSFHDGLTGLMRTDPVECSSKSVGAAPEKMRGFGALAGGKQADKANGRGGGLRAGRLGCLGIF